MKQIKKKHKKISTRQVLVLSFATLFIFLIGSLYFALKTGTGPLSVFLESNSINKIELNEGNCGQQLGYHWDEVRGCVKNTHVSQQETIKNQTEAEKAIAKKNLDARNKAQETVQNATHPQTPSTGSSNTTNTSCPGGNGAKLQPDTYVPTGYGLDANGNRCKTSGCPHRECIYIDANCKHGATSACDAVTDKSKLILPAGAGPEYTVGMTQAELGKKKDDQTLQARATLGGACIDKSGVNVPQGTLQGTEQCLDGNWTTPTKYDNALAKVCDPNTQQYNTQEDKCETKPLAAETCDKPAWCGSASGERNWLYTCTINSGIKTISHTDCGVLGCDSSTNACKELKNENPRNGTSLYDEYCATIPAVGSTTFGYVDQNGKPCDQIRNTVAYTMKVNTVNPNGTIVTGGERTNNPADCKYGSVPFEANPNAYGLQTVSICKDYLLRTTASNATFGPLPPAPLTPQDPKGIVGGEADQANQCKYTPKTKNAWTGKWICPSEQDILTANIAQEDVANSVSIQCPVGTIETNGQCIETPKRPDAEECTSVVNCQSTCNGKYTVVNVKKPNDLFNSKHYYCGNKEQVVTAMEEKGNPFEIIVENKTSDNYPPLSEKLIDSGIGMGAGGTVCFGAALLAAPFIGPLTIPGYAICSGAAILGGVIGYNSN